MPSVKKTRAFAAGERFNFMQGSQYEFLNFPAFVEFAIFRSGLNPATAIITTGTDALLVNGELDEKPVTESITREDIQFTDTVLPGERIVAEVTNGTVAQDIRALINITPL